jgi:hypothetical protein
MDVLTFVNEYKAVLGGVVIGSATITGVLLNVLHNKRLDTALKKERTASTASAVASELLYNSYTLRHLYLELSGQKKRKPELTEYKHIDMQVYQKLLSRVGEFGSVLTFMVVDAYGDIKRIKGRVEILSERDLLHDNRKDAFLNDIKFALVKALSCSLVMYIYADYMNGRKWMQKIREQRVIRIERTLESFCKFVEQTESDMDFISTEEEGGLEFRKRFKNLEDRKNVKELFAVIHRVLDNIQKNNQWNAQLSCRALSYKMQNTLTCLLDTEPDEYDILSEQEYNKFL